MYSFQLCQTHTHDMDLWKKNTCEATEQNSNNCQDCDRLSVFGDEHMKQIPGLWNSARPVIDS